MSTDISNLPIYCLTFRNPEKKARVQARFDAVGLPVEFVESIAWDDPEIALSSDVIQQAMVLNRWSKMAWSCMHGHLKIIKKFLDTNLPRCIICEDDIMLHKHMAVHLPHIMYQFDDKNTHMMLLGYLTPDKFANPMENWNLLPYEFNVYGTQMYVINRGHAEFIWNTCAPHTGAGIAHLTDPNLISFNADWIITKAVSASLRSRLTPLMAIEERGGGKSYGDPFQEYWHDLCHDSHYSPHIFI